MVLTLRYQTTTKMGTMSRLYGTYWVVIEILIISRRTECIDNALTKLDEIIINNNIVGPYVV